MKQFYIPIEVINFNNMSMRANKDKIIEEALRKYYKKHPIKFRNMLKHGRVELRRDNYGRFVENYYHKDELICSWVGHQDGIKNHGELREY
jgi:hypothetical protein